MPRTIAKRALDLRRLGSVVLGELAEQGLDEARAVGRLGREAQELDRDLEQLARVVDELSARVDVVEPRARAEDAVDGAGDACGVLRVHLDTPKPRQRGPACG